MDPQHLIVLQGAYCVGKTLRLNLLINMLDKAYPRIRIPAGRGYLPDWMEWQLIDTPKADLLNNELTLDHVAAFLVNGKVVVVCTGGDDEAAIQANTTILEKLSATIGITAVRLKSDSSSCMELARVIEERQLSDVRYVRAYRENDSDTYASIADAGARELYDLVLSLCC